MEKDNIEAYPVTFERIMEAHKVARDRWAHHLAPQLTGKAQLAFSALPSSESADFDAIKKAVLARYDVNEEAYRRRFRALTRSNGETNREVAVKLMDLQQKWLKECKNMDDIKEAIGIEQFLNTLPPEKRIWLTERKPRTCVEAGELADEYEQARKQDPSGQKATPHKKCNFCHKQGHLEQECRKKKASGAGLYTGETGQPMCFNCRKYGHISKRCPEKSALMCKGTTREVWMYRTGLVEGYPTDSILLDTGCSRTMVQRWLVPEGKMLPGEAVTISCAHGDTVLYPLASLQLQVEGLPLQIKAAVSDTLPVAVLLGTDVPELVQLVSTGLGAQSETQEDVMVVMTRAHAKQQLEEEIRRREKEVQ